MKAPVNFGKVWYNLLKEEATMVAISFNSQLGNGCLPFAERGVEKPKFLTEKISDNVVRHMGSRDIDTLLNFFACPGIYVATYKSKPGLFISVPSENCVNGILRHVSKVRPVRAIKYNKNTERK